MIGRDTSRRRLLRCAGRGRVAWCAALAATLAAAGARADALGPEIDVWYGTPQTFGVPGLAQQWVNVLGNVSDPDGVAALSYTLNGGPPRTLSIGKDSRRLVSTGDFNVEIDFAELASGANTVAITARDSQNNTSVANVTLNYSPSTVWPLPFEMDLAGVTDIQDVAQVVDGEWIIESNGLRCPTMGYDRVLAVGDLDWSEYEVTATITMLDMDPGGFAWPSVSPGFGITLRWPGHSDDPVVCVQPHCGWLPSGAGVWYDAGHDGPLVLDGDLGLFQQQARTLDYDVPYVFKLRVESAGELGTFYAAKVWAEGDAEPAGWEMSGYEPVGDVPSGSCIFVAHHVDIRIEDVAVVALGHTAPPVISAVQVVPGATSATITWQTDEPTTGFVSYGPTAAYEDGDVASPGSGTAHGVELLGLTSGVTYHYRITAIDLNSNAAVTEDATFVALADSDPPVISNVQVAPDQLSATISWNTDEPATSRVEYGLTNAYGNATSNGALVTAHVLDLFELAPDTLYHYRVLSTDASGNTQSTGDLTFATPPDPPSELVSDSFNQPELDTSLWTFVNPLGDAAVSMTGTQVQIALPVTGSDHEIWTSGNTAPRITQAAPDADFEFVVKFDSPLTEQLQIQGVAVEQDAVNVIRAEFHRLNGTNRIYVASIFAGDAVTHIHQPVPVAPPMFLRVRRDGDAFTVSWSTDGDNWTVAAAFAQPMTVTAVAIHMGAGAGSAHAMLADYFLDVSEPPLFDCNLNGIDDAEDLAAGTSQDCNASGVPDECELAGNDCDSNGVPDECDVDCNSNAVPDACEVFADCNASGVPDECELAGNDCDSNGAPDECDPDCNSNAVPDACEVFADCNISGVPDECELAGNDCDSNGVPDECDPDCNSNAVPDACEAFTDCNFSGVPDECELAGNDCDSNGVPDECDVDCNSNAVPDACESFTDCNFSGVPDECELTGNDCDSNGVPDECDPDCNSNAVPDACESFTDCNANGVPDECELAGNDCDNNGVPDECDVDCNSNAVPDACESFTDCNFSGIPDECELAGNDCDTNGVPDECDPDCNSNAVPDACEAFADCNFTGVPDECELAGNDCDSNGVPDECDPDCNSNAVPDACEAFADCNFSGVPDECELAGNDCDSNGVPDECDPDCNSNAIPDACEAFADCNFSGVPDECELAGNDCDTNGVPDECDPDCNSNAVPDACESITDCNFSGIPDECELAGNDCNVNKVPDECDVDCNANGVPDDCEFHFDCNTNAWPDSCDILGGSSADVNEDLVPDECQVRNLTQNSAHPTIAAALAFAQADDELLATPAHFEAEPVIDLQGKPVVLRSTYAIDLPDGGAFTLADGALLAAAPGYGIRQRGTLTARPMHDAELLADRFEQEETGQLTVSVSAGLMVTAPSGATLTGSVTLQPQATLVFSSDATIGGACALFGGVLSADQLHVAGALAELYGYGAVVADLVNDASVVFIADSQVIGDFTNNGTTTIQNGTLTLTGSLFGDGVIIGGDSGGRSDDAPRSGAGVLFVAGDLVAGPAAGLYFSASTWSVRVGGDFDVAIASGQDVDLVDAELRLTGLGKQEQLLEALSEDIGPVPAGWVRGAPGRFPIGRLTIGPTPTTVRLVNQHPNADPPEMVQAFYVDTLTVHAGATLITDGLRIYYRHLHLEGLVDEPGNLVPIEAPPGDCDLDGDSDLDDLPGLLDCLAGPQVAAPEFSALGCGCIATYDRDLDLDIDLHDFASFQAALEAP